MILDFFWKGETWFLKIVMIDDDFMVKARIYVVSLYILDFINFIIIIIIIIIRPNLNGKQRN